MTTTVKGTRRVQRKRTTSSPIDQEVGTEAPGREESPLVIVTIYGIEKTARLLRVSNLGEGYIEWADGSQRWVPANWWKQPV